MTRIVLYEAPRGRIAYGPFDSEEVAEDYRSQWFYPNAQTSILPLSAE